MHVLRTPDERFADLPDYPFEPHHAKVAANGGSMRVLVRLAPFCGRQVQLTDRVSRFLFDGGTFRVECISASVGGAADFPHGAIRSYPGGDPVGRHRQGPAAFVHQVVMGLTERQQIVEVGGP